MFQNLKNKLLHYCIPKKNQDKLPSNNKHIIGENVFIKSGSQFLNRKTIIGQGTRINGPILVKGSGELRIGNYCALGDAIRIITTNHDMTTLNLQVMLQKQIGARDNNTENGEVNIGHNSWVGDQTIFVPGASVGVGSIVGAGAVVTKDFPHFSIVAGNPARLIRMRFCDEVIRALLELGWWHWELNQMIDARDLFNADFTRMKTDTLIHLIEKYK